METYRGAGIPSIGHGTDHVVVDPPDPVHDFIQLLGRHPDALVAAIGNDGIVTRMPDDVPLINHRIVVARSVIDVVVAADKRGVIDAWERSRQEGEGNTIVHLLTDPDQAVVITIVDATKQFGVHLAMLVATTGHNGNVGHREFAAVAPRTARVVKNPVAVIQSIDAATTAILGWQADELVGRRSLDLIHPDDQDRSISNWMEMLTAPGHGQRVRLRHLCADGSWKWMEITNHNKVNADDEPCVIADMLDISEELAAQEALRASEQRLRRLAESLPLGVLQIETDGRISYANARLAAITGSTSTDSIDEQFVDVTAGDRAVLDASLAEVLRVGTDQDIHIDFVDSRTASEDARDTTRHCTMSMRSLTSDAGVVTGAIICVSDVSDQVRMTAELEHRATIDALTGCFNRGSIVARLEACIADLRTGVAIVYVDLDDFKTVNDELGHAAGDTLLAAVGALLRGTVRNGDLVGRMGGDEFLVVCPDMVDTDEALELAARIAAMLEHGITVGEDTLVMNASLGVAYTSDPSMSSDHLVAEADIEMYVDKRDRKQNMTAGSARASRSRHRLAEESLELRHAIQRGQLEVHYQPIVTLPAEDLFGVEALVRWRRGGATVPAGSFIETAERSGLIVEIGDFVLDASVFAASDVAPCSDHLRWFINMSPGELAKPSKSAEMRAVLDRYHLDASRVVVEVTEHTNLAKSPEALRTLSQFADLGVTIALDDFGTGYSSLALLRSVPVSYLKFDRSFTVDLCHDPIAAILLDTCMDLAGRMEMVVIAEGVETPEQRSFLVDRGVTLAQGYVFSPPQPIEHIVGLQPDATR